jgi:glycosyltransferase involved in cell wall biosynthesis
MRIIATTRTRNEERNIKRFCEVYSRFCNEVLIVDGGSEDDTVSLASEYQKVKTLEFNERVYGKNNLWRNPHGKHINTCIDWAKERGADWIIFDDCDDVPNLHLQRNAREIFKRCDVLGMDAVFGYRLYVYGTNLYFPEMNKPGQSLWAWNVRTNIRAMEDNPWGHEMTFPSAMKKFNLEIPHCLLHYFAPNEETIQKKLDFYIRSGQHPNLTHPLTTNGALESLPEFAIY